MFGMRSQWLLVSRAATTKRTYRSSAGHDLCPPPNVPPSERLAPPPRAGEAIGLVGTGSMIERDAAALGGIV